MQKIINRYSMLSIVVSAAFSFIVVNVYWLLTVTYHLAEKAPGKPGTLVGFDAAEKILRTNGVSAYLDGVGAFYMFTFLCAVAGCMVKNRRIVLTSAIITLVGAILYYATTIKIYSRNMVEGKTYVVSGVDALIEVGFAQSAINIIGIFILLYLATVLSVYVVRKFPAADVKPNG